METPPDTGIPFDSLDDQVRRWLGAFGALVYLNTELVSRTIRALIPPDSLPPDIANLLNAARQACDQALHHMPMPEFDMYLTSADPNAVRNLPTIPPPPPTSRG